MTVPSVTELNRIGADCLPGHLGVAITRADNVEVRAEMAVSMKLMAPNGYLHAGSVVTLDAEIVLREPRLARARCRFRGLPEAAFSGILLKGHDLYILPTDSPLGDRFRLGDKAMISLYF